MDKIEYIWLSNLDISNTNKMRLIQKFGGIENLYNCSLEDLIELSVKEQTAIQILNRNTKEKAYRDAEYMQKNNIHIVCYKDKEYPIKFKLLKDRPVAIYVKGDLNILQQEAVGIVGSRVALKESLEIARLLASSFADKGINVISGLAKGIDKFAHLGVLDVNSSKKGKTIGVLACGLNKKSFYPQENLKLYERIIKGGGAVISEYPIGTKPKPYYFPLRNRLISGLADKIFVIQASTLKSGSMITVDYALDQGKDVFVYQSTDNNNPYFEGNRMLIEEGAKIFKI